MSDMQEMTMRTLDILDHVRKNLGNHREVFLKAQEGYRAQVIQELDKIVISTRPHKLLKQLLKENPR